ncbi:unnamed protein product [Sphenostylis stenocarpa]|uniref:Uncharacterized protein n=1 Tax=Sphenostylis stenocarpa TaxID=92480 RepID=A0AA86V989_9FABA|nr:unnamed protein product [Sphenostylis stenocarpa]
MIETGTKKGGNGVIMQRYWDEKKSNEYLSKSTLVFVMEVYSNVFLTRKHVCIINLHVLEVAFVSNFEVDIASLNGGKHACSLLGTQKYTDWGHLMGPSLPVLCSLPTLLS